jgi:simple sugar transport system substrate-binding protein
MLDVCRPDRRFRLFLPAPPGLLAVQEKFGDKVETAYLESVPEGPTRSARWSAWPVTAATSSSPPRSASWTPVNKVAKRFPEVKFEHATGFKQESENVALYNARFYEGRYIIGQIAAKQSKAGLAGYIVSFPIPEVIMGINAFMLGAQTSTRLQGQDRLGEHLVRSRQGGRRRQSAVRSGRDIIVQHTDSTAPLQIAQERGLHGFGQASDMIKFAPESQYTAIVDDWAPYYTRRIRSCSTAPGSPPTSGKASRKAPF